MEQCVYRIKVGVLEIGDIILTNGDNELGGENKKGWMKSNIIRKISNSDYSHVMIYLGGTCAHAIGEGVEYFNLSKYFIFSKEKIKVLRLKKYLSEENKEKLKVFVAERHGNEYAYIKAGKSAFKLPASNDINQQFCSKLVADAFESIGIKIKEEFASENINPKDIQECEKFKEIDVNFDEILKTNAIEIVEKKRQSLEAQTASVKKLRVRLKEICNEYNLEFLNYQATLFRDIPNLKNMPNFKAINSEISQAIKESGFDSFWKYDIKDNPEIYSVKEKKELYSKERQHAIKLFISYTTLAMEEIKKEKVRLEELYKSSDLEVSYNLMKLFTKIVNKHYSIIFTNFKALQFSINDYRLDNFSKFENFNLEEVTKIHTKNINKIEKILEQGEKFNARLTREIRI